MYLQVDEKEEETISRLKKTAPREGTYFPFLKRWKLKRYVVKWSSWLNALNQPFHSLLEAFSFYIYCPCVINGPTCDGYCVCALDRDWYGRIVSGIYVLSSSCAPFLWHSPRFSCMLKPQQSFNYSK